MPKRSPEWALIFALRLSALFYLSRREFALPSIECKASEGGFQLTLPRAWLEKHPLTEAALESEIAEWRALGIRVALRAASGEGRQRVAAAAQA
jgi:exopolyphosphatase/guanosine-5'-triphosphate,3'-diphosphate pyrophosphatase